ncbi:HAD family hydrolase [Fulvivirga sp. RKSG066]|uniref:HAD family hydrolase n=1 Tax=Fulvivirga aurantia TaxID=2529383 RepID=UPI0012BD37B5|nr:HAD family hydrolase [Fulvivirga aurantia]MTI21948.1 HAD family hydrolase [Fulvivirga aurantia]
MALKVIGFDADDTLWVNENYFREAEDAFCELLSDFLPKEEVMKILFDIEMKNLEIYGFGIKGFMLSMTETVVEIAGEKATHEMFAKVLSLGKEMLNKPVELLDEVENILNELKDRYRIILVTKGDLLDQQRKLEKSQLEKFFHHVEVMSNKHERDYQKLIKHLDVKPEEFLMIGNSLKSDILPVVKIGAKAIYVPYEITWQHEAVSKDEDHGVGYQQVESLSEVLNYL